MSDSDFVPILIDKKTYRALARGKNKVVKSGMWKEMSQTEGGSFFGDIGHVAKNIGINVGKTVGKVAVDLAKDQVKKNISKKLPTPLANVANLAVDEGARYGKQRIDGAGFMDIAKSVGKSIAKEGVKIGAKELKKQAGKKMGMFAPISNAVIDTGSNYAQQRIGSGNQFPSEVTAFHRLEQRGGSYKF